MTTKIDLGFWLWLVGFAKAIADWLGDLGPDKTEPIEHVDPRSPDAAPSPKQKRKYQGIPGFDSETGTWR